MHFETCGDTLFEQKSLHFHGCVIIICIIVWNKETNNFLTLDIICQPDQEKRIENSLLQLRRVSLIVISNCLF